MIIVKFNLKRLFCKNNYNLLLLVLPISLILLSCNNDNLVNNNDDNFNWGSVTDIDGNIYKTIKIGKQEWQAENLRTTKYNDGTPIIKDTIQTTWNNGTIGKYCYYNFTKNIDSIVKFGSLYNWYVVNPANIKQIAPIGWHVPDTSDWNILENYLIDNGYNWDETKIGNKIAKAVSAKTDWIISNWDGVIGNDLSKNNKSGFSALPSGKRSSYCDFCNIGDSGFWWITTEYDTTNSYVIQLTNNFENLYRTVYFKSCGFSLRLVKDN